jgi:hypothetical protein
VPIIATRLLGKPQRAGVRFDMPDRSDTFDLPTFNYMGGHLWPIT